MQKKRIVKWAWFRRSLSGVLILFSAVNPLFASPQTDAALRKASEDGNLEQVKRSLSAGANVNSSDADGITPLVAAAANGHPEIITLLVTRGASLEKATKVGQTPLHAAVILNKPECVRVLIEAKANLDAIEENGATPLMLAAFLGHTEVAALLIKAGADTSVKSKNGATAYSVAAGKKNLEMMRLLDPDQTEAYELPADQALLLGEFHDSDGVREPGVQCTLTALGAEFHRTETTDSRGRFKMILNKGQKYSIGCDKFGNKIEFKDTLNIPQSEGPFTQRLELIVQYVQEYKKTYKLENVYFDTGKSELRREAIPALNTLASAMLENLNMIVEIAGHTDNVGGVEHNMELARQRAEAVRAYVIDKGVQPERIIAKGYGPVKPVADNNTEAGRKQNRRTEAKVIRE